MARFKDFDAAETERTGDLICFRMGDQEWTAKHVNAANYLRIARQEIDGGASVLAVSDYILSTLQEDQREAFTAMLGERDIQLVTLMELGKWIVEQATGNPTSAASSSPARPSRTGQPLRVYSLDPKSTPEDSVSAAG